MWGLSSWQQDWVVLSHSVLLDSAPSWTIARQSPLSMVFSRQEYWSGFPYPPLGDLPNPGIEPRSPILQVDSLLSETPGKLKTTGVGSLSLLQGIFPTQESNQGLLQCRQFLHQLSYQGRSHFTERRAPTRASHCQGSYWTTCDSCWILGIPLCV